MGLVFSRPEDMLGGGLLYGVRERAVLRVYAVIHIFQAERIQIA